MSGIRIPVRGTHRDLAGASATWSRPMDVGSGVAGVQRVRRWLMRPVRRAR